MQIFSPIIAFGSALGPRAAVPAAPSIASISRSGNGCPQGSKFEVVSEGKQFKLYEFETRGPGVETRTQNCALHMDLDGEPGWQGQGLSYFLTNFWIQDAADTTTVQGSWMNKGATVNGPLVIEIEIPAASRNWSPCSTGGTTNPNFRTAIEDSGYFGTGSNTVTTETLKYEWRQC